jgi:hypothetical protein
MTRTAFDELALHAPGPTADVNSLFPNATARRTTRRIRRPTILVAAVAAVTATVLVVPMVMPGGTASAAALDTLSATAGRQPAGAPAAILHMVFTERFEDQGVTRHESWTLADGTTWRRDIESDGSERYMKIPPLESWLPATVAALPTDPGAMATLIRKQASGSISTNSAVFTYYGDALRLGYVPPAVRRSMIGAMKQLPFIRAQRSTTADGVACLQITYYEPFEFFNGHYYCFDESTSAFLEEGRTFFGSLYYRSTFTVSDYVSTVPAAVVSQAIDYTEPNGGSSETPSPTATPS